MPVIVCGNPGCGVTFNISPSHLARTKHAPTCSPTCRRERMRGSGHWNWKGGSHIGPHGYRYIWVADAGEGKPGYVLEHRHVMEQKLGRKLHPDEIVHHRDDDRTNNRPSNLELAGSRGSHTVTHHVGRDATGRFRKMTRTEARRQTPRTGRDRADRHASTR